MEQRDFFRKLADLASMETQVVVATVVRTAGSTPREVGAKMVIRPDGTFFGTIGGGCGEAEVWQRARQVFVDQQAALVEVDLTEDPERGGEAICGGRMEVLLDLWNQDELAHAMRMLTPMDQGQALVLVSRVLPGSTQHAHLVVSPQGWQTGSLGEARLDAAVARMATNGEARTGLMRTKEAMGSLQSWDAPGQRRAPLCSPELKDTASLSGAMAAEAPLFVEFLESPPHLIIAGAGHCAIPLARLGRMLGFRLTILDDRPECATQERFPDADALRVGDLAEELRSIPLDHATYLVLVTRGHKLDEVLLREALGQPLAYIGMIGSKRRTRAVFEGMRHDGYDPQHLNSVHAPIGLDLGAQTPEEIAVAIMAEIILVRKSRTGTEPSGRPLSKART